MKVERVEIVEFGESEDAGEGQQDVEHEDEHEVGKDEPVDVTLLADGRDQGRQAVVAHERVDAHAEQVWHSHHVGHDGCRVGLHAPGQPDTGQDDHGPEGKPPHESGQHLEVLGLSHVEEPEWPDHRDEDGQHDSGREKLRGYDGSELQTLRLSGRLVDERL